MGGLKFDPRVASDNHFQRKNLKKEFSSLTVVHLTEQRVLGFLVGKGFPETSLISVFIKAAVWFLQHFFLSQMTYDDLSCDQMVGLDWSWSGPGCLPEVYLNRGIWQVA